MNPTYISSLILMPGAMIPSNDDGICPTRVDYNNVVHIDEIIGGRIYSVTRGKVIKDGEWEEDFEGRLTEQLFLLTELREISTRAGQDDRDWLVDYMADTGYEYLEEGHMKALYEAAKGYVSTRLVLHNLAAQHDAPEREEVVIPVSFIGDWSVSMSYYEMYPEIDSIDFMGVCKIVEKDA